MIKLKRLLEQPGFDKKKAEKAKADKAANGLEALYILKAKNGVEKTATLSKIFDAYKLEAGSPSIGKKGFLTRTGLNTIISRSKVDNPRNPIVSITLKSDIDARAEVLRKYEDNEVPNAMEENWTDNDKHNYDINVWNKMKEYSKALQTWWADVEKEGSEANRLFNRKGVQGYYFWQNDDEKLARDLWWNQSTTGKLLYDKLEKIKKTETELLNKLHSGDLKPPSQVQNIMTAMRNEPGSKYGNGDETVDSIYEEIIELINNDVEWDIQHPLLVSEYEKYLVDPEIDTE